MSLGHFHFAPRTCFSWTGIGIANHDIMDNLSQLHCVFDILSGALYTLTFEAHRLLPAWLLSARESCWRNVEEFARNMPRGQMETLRRAAGLQRQCQELDPRKRESQQQSISDQSQSNVRVEQSMDRNYGEGCILYRDSRYQAGDTHICGP